MRITQGAETIHTLSPNRSDTVVFLPGVQQPGWERDEWYENLKLFLKFGREYPQLSTYDSQLLKA
jgi:hypothetical protein